MIHYPKVTTNGFSLLELLVATSILSIISLVALSIFTDLFKSVTTADVQKELMGLNNEVSTILRVEKSCTNALAGTSNAEGTEITLANNLQAGAKFGPLNINSIQLANISSVSGPLERATIILTGEKRGQIFGSKDFTQRFNIMYEYNATGEIVRCLGAGYDSITTCSGVGGTWDETTGTCDICASVGGTPDGAGGCILSNGGCTPPPQYTWGTDCGAPSSGNLSNGQSILVNNTLPGYSGSVTFTCTNGAITESAQNCIPSFPPSGTWQAVYIGFWWDELGGAPGTGPYQDNPSICGGGAIAALPATCPMSGCSPIGATMPPATQGALCPSELPPAPVRTNFSYVYQCVCQ